MNNKRKICFIITSYVHYSRGIFLLEELMNSPNVELQIVVGGSALIDRFGSVMKEMRESGYKINSTVTMLVDGGTSISMAKTVGLGICEFSSIFENLKPDIILIRGDRFEVLAPVIAASYLNIPIAHIEGGDVTGNIDESVRHAITKFSNYHFPTNEESRDRIIRMGERPEMVFNVGCLGVEMISRHTSELSEDLINYLGVGGAISTDKDFIVVMYHPVTSEMENNKLNTNTLLEVISKINLPTIWFWPNVDAGTDEVSKAIRIMREKGKTNNIRFIKYVPADQFIALLKKAKVLVGNSSAGIKESSFLGTPVVNIGARQNGRKKGKNVISVDYSKDKIMKAIKRQIECGAYERDEIYFKENTAKRIVNILEVVDIYTQKVFYDNKDISI